MTNNKARTRAPPQVLLRCARHYKHCDYAVSVYVGCRHAKWTQYMVEKSSPLPLLKFKEKEAFVLFSPFSPINIQSIYCILVIWNTKGILILPLCRTLVFEVSFKADNSRITPFWRLLSRRRMFEYILRKKDRQE